MAPLLQSVKYASNMRQFGDLLLEARRKRDLSQRKLAEQLAEYGVAIDASAIMRMENGQREPKLSEAFALAAYLDFSLDTLEFAPKNTRLEYRSSRDAACRALITARQSVVECAKHVGHAQNLWDELDFDTNYPDEESVDKGLYDVANWDGGLVETVASEEYITYLLALISDGIEFDAGPSTAARPRLRSESDSDGDH